MFSIYLLLISLIAIAIITQAESLTAEQTELIPIPVSNRELEARRIKAN